MSMPISRSVFATLALLTLSLASCRDASKASTAATTTPAASSLPTVPVEIGTKRFTLEIANDDGERQKGLMDRDAMPADRGMIFVFPDVQPRGFWMHHTRIPLDILYLDAVGRVVSIHQMKAMDETTVVSKGPARYAIELNLNVAASTGVREGHIISIPPAAQRADD